MKFNIVYVYEINKTVTSFLAEQILHTFLSLLIYEGSRFIAVNVAPDESVPPAEYSPMIQFKLYTRSVKIHIDKSKYMNETFCKNSQELLT
jgi:hypothetical protein